LTPRNNHHDKSFQFSWKSFWHHLFFGFGGMGIYEFNRPDEVPWFITLLCFILSILGLLMVFARGYRADQDDE
jgi:hypothetical protein